MKRKLAIILIAAIFNSYIPTPVYADATDDQIAKIEKQIEILQAQLEKLKRKKGEQTETETEAAEQAEDVVIGAAEPAVGEKYKITPIQAYYKDSGQRYFDEVKAKPGNTFVVVKLEIENISDTDDYFNWLNFDCYVDGYSTDVTLDVLDRDDPTAVGDIRAGKKLIGCIALEIPVDWQELEIGYKEEYMGSTISTTIAPDSPIFQ